MEGDDLKAYLGRRKEQYQLLLNESACLLRNLDTCDPEEVTELIARRQKIIDQLQNDDHSLQTISVGSDQRQLDEFRSFQEVVTRRILELDGLVIALTQAQLNIIKGDLVALAKRRVVLTAYEGNGHGMGGESPRHR